MKASLIYDLEQTPVGIQIFPSTDDEKKLVQSLLSARFNIPTIMKKMHPETETTVSIQITIDKQQV